MAQSADQLQAAKELAQFYGLSKEDMYEHRQSKSLLITRTGIEKIQYKAGISISFQAVRSEIDFASVKAIAVKPAKKGVVVLQIETFGSASKANCQMSYFLEMAEKRALSRAVLKLTDFYQLGVYGEDEMQPTDYKAEPTPAPNLVIDKPIKYPTIEQKGEIIKHLNHPLITMQERTKMLLNINRLDEERATQAIDKLKEAIEKRGGTAPDGINQDIPDGPLPMSKDELNKLPY